MIVVVGVVEDEGEDEGDKIALAKLNTVLCHRIALLCGQKATPEEEIKRWSAALYHFKSGLMYSISKSPSLEI